MGSLQTLVDARASALYRTHGYTPSYPPNLLEFARLLLGAEAIALIPSPHPRRPSPLSLVPAGCRVRLQMGRPDEENVLALARGIASWDVSRPGCPVGANNVERLALSVALPIEAMDRYHAAGASPEEIAEAMILPLATVLARECAFVKLRSVRRLIAAAPIAPEDFVAGAAS